jgi:hypothetical protein
MAGGWIRKRCLIVVRTYPAPAKSVIEASCTAAISADGKWVRMFPVPARLLEYDKRFAKWFWIEVDLVKASSDARPESYKLNPDSIVISDGVGTQGNWRARRDLIKPLQRPSMCQIQRERDEHKSPTLGVIQKTYSVIHPLRRGLSGKRISARVRRWGVQGNRCNGSKARW